MTTLNRPLLSVVLLFFVSAACVDDESPPTSSRAEETRPPSTRETTSVPPEGSDFCVDFEDLALGGTFVVGDLFGSGGVEFEVSDFTWDDGTVFSGGHAEVGNGGLTGGSTQELVTNNVLVRVGFPSVPVSVLTFDFGAHGGNNNIEINGDFVNFGSFTDIDGATIGGALFELVTLAGTGEGSAAVSGSVDSFAIGGQEFAIDNICVDSQ